jgi:hypothetical protein
MAIFLLPRKNEPSAETDAIIKKMGAEVFEVKNLYDYVKASDFSATQFFSMDDNTFTKLMRNIGDLTPEGEMPRVLFGAPGYVASPRFVSESGAIIHEEWKDIEPMFLKSGMMAMNKDEAQERSVEERKGLAPNDEKGVSRVAAKINNLVNTTSGDEDVTLPEA